MRYLYYIIAAIVVFYLGYFFASAGNIITENGSIIFAGILGAVIVVLNTFVQIHKDEKTQKTLNMVMLLVSLVLLIITLNSQIKSANDQRAREASEKEKDSLFIELNKKQVDSMKLSLLHSRKLINAQDTIISLQRKNSIAQSKYDRLNQKYISESTAKISSQFNEERSNPKLKFGSFNKAANKGTIILDNYDGDDPATNIKGYFRKMGLNDDHNVYPAVHFGPYDIPSKSVFKYLLF